MDSNLTLLKEQDFVSKFGWSTAWLDEIKQKVDAGISFEEPQIPFEEFTKRVFISLQNILVVENGEFFSIGFFKKLVSKVVDGVSDKVNHRHVHNLAKGYFAQSKANTWWSAKPLKGACTAEFLDELFFRKDDKVSVQEGQLSLPSAESPTVRFNQLVLSTPKRCSSYTAVLSPAAGTPYTSGVLDKDNKKTLRKKALNVQIENEKLLKLVADRDEEIQQLKSELAASKKSASALHSSLGRLKRENGANNCPVQQKKPKSNRLAEQNRSEIIDTMTAGGMGGGGVDMSAVGELSWLREQPGISDVLKGKKDFIVIEDRFDDDEGFFHGTQYFGRDSNKTLATTGNQFVFVRVKRHLDRKNSNSRNTLVAKAMKLRRILSFFVGSSWNDVKRGTADYDKMGVTRLLGEFFKKYRFLFDDLTQGVDRLIKQPKMTVHQAVDFKGLLGLSNAAIRRMRVILGKFDLNIFPSDRGMRSETANRISFLQAACMSTERVQMDTGKPPKSKIVDVVKAGDLAKYIESVYRLDGPHRAFSTSENTIQIVIGGDKGGESMKFHFQLVHPETNVYDCHIFCFYKGSDKAQSMRKVLPPFNSSIEVMCSTGLEDLNVEFFLGGDFKFLDAVLGHQGSSATYPSPKDDCTLSHLQEHGNRSHTPEDCTDILVRNTTELYELYNENLAHSDQGCDDWLVFEGSTDGLAAEESLSGDSDDDETDQQVVRKKSLQHALNANGKKHGNIVAPSMLRTIDLDNVVPPVLHITLGIVLRLFNKLISLCRTLDEPSQGTELEKIDSLWEEKSIELSNAEDLLRGSGRDILDRMNHLLRLKALKNAEGEEELVRIARDCYAGKKPKRAGDFYFCDNSRGNSRLGVSCVLTAWDYDLGQIQCNSCLAWYHCTCEGIITSNYTAVTSAKEYMCVRCKEARQPAAYDLDFFIEYVKSKLVELEKEQIELDNLFVSLTDECSSLKSQQEDKVGPKEKQLLGVLDDLKVDRQAYHGNVFVGNHCKIILRNYDALLKVISGKATLWVLLVLTLLAGFFVRGRQSGSPIFLHGQGETLHIPPSPMWHFCWITKDNLFFKALYNFRLPRNFLVSMIQYHVSVSDLCWDRDYECCLSIFRTAWKAFDN